ncbi:multiple epidermal growth factor-like domains protein 10 [Haliotis rufescens]|uniref:multiple epidermal growth factor-like domains protein 10 n=1 Tax=Haliotis rufescens TaxID=6454 RepID=UPI00201F6E3D|nr:multiple epidermal growth factor-like domains protein 10 [Haliotis rufescens]
MKFVKLLLLLCQAAHSPGARCRDNQQCSDCDDNTANCLTQCHKGYFGQTCRSVCSSNCRNNTCQLIASRGIGRCTEGCEPGYQGYNCIRPCGRHIVTCTPCPGGCDGNYCHIGRTCYEGCKESFYGLECKTCSDECKVCNRKTGICEECRPPHFGPNCEHSCVNCLGSCEDGCTIGCVPGFYGNFCTEICSEGCRPPYSIYTVDECQADDVNLSADCRPECHNQSGECVYGCLDGWYGPQCSSQCSPRCAHQRCDGVGDCVEGCVVGRWGSSCESCSENCLHQACHTNSGLCLHGCSSGHHGEYCNLTCTSCSTDGCQQTVNCTSNYTLPEDLAGSFNTSAARTGETLTVTVTVIVLFVPIILVACCIWYWRRRYKRRQHESEGAFDDIPRRRDTSSAVYQTIELYWEIKDEDIDIHIPSQNKETAGEDGDTDLPVLADCYPGGEAVDEAGDDAPGTSTKDYGHLERGVHVDPKIVVSYISPVDD